MSDRYFLSKARWCVLAVALLLALPAVSLAQNLGMGATYEGFDAQVQRLVMHFSDATVITERTENGVLTSQVAPAGAHEGLSLSYLPDGTLEIRSDLVEEGAQTMARRSATSASSDWAALQAYVLWRDLKGLNLFPTGAGQLDWSGAFVRPRGAVRDSTLDVAEHVAETYSRLVGVDADFGRYQTISRVEARPERPERDRIYPSFVSRLFDRETGAEIGLARYYPERKLWTWSVFGISEGNVSPENVPGGMFFEPNMTWANVQLFAFEQLYGANLFEAAEGCTGLHWLDGTIFRKCCDKHDDCFEKYDCTYKSWWTTQGGWRCDWCNLKAIFCFVTLGITPTTGGGGGGGSGGGGGGDQCDYSSGWCPPSCMSCSSGY